MDCWPLWVDHLLAVWWHLGRVWQCVLRGDPHRMAAELKWAGNWLIIAAQTAAGDIGVEAFIGLASVTAALLWFARRTWILFDTEDF